jgi:flagellar hook-associated protein 2
MATVSAPSLGLSGLASGVDTSGIVQQLMAVDQQSLVPIQQKQAVTTTHQSKLKALASAVTALKTAADALKDPATWQSKQTTASTSTNVGVTLLSGAGIGGHTVQVDRLASSAQHGYSFTQGTSAGTFDIYYGSDPTATGASKVTITVGANATAADVATAINANEASPVYAAAVTDPATGKDRLVLSSRKTGQSGDFTVDASGMSAGPLAEDATYARTGTMLNALYKLDGDTTDRSAETNAVDNALPGLRLTFTGVTASPASITTTAASIDTKGAQKKVQAFVDAYNSLVDLGNANLTEKSVLNPTTTADLVKGSLFGDIGVQSMLSQMHNQVMSKITGLGSYSSLADIGVGIPAASAAGPTDDAKDGKITLDADKLTSALTTDWTQVRNLFSGVGTTKGFTATFDDFANKQVGSNGLLTSRQTSDDTTLKDLQDQLDTRNAQLAAEQQRLTAQFTAMETALQQSQTQQSWLTSQIASL